MEIINQGNKNMQNPNFKTRLPIVSLVLREKKFFINPTFQLQFMGWMVIISIISMALIYMANLYFFSTYLDKVASFNLAPDHPYYLLIHEQKEFLTKVFLSVSLLISSVVCLWGLFYSHKIAGPMYRLEQYFNHAARTGKPIEAKIYFRKTDFFQNIPESINKYVESSNFLRRKDEDPSEKDVA